MESAMGLQFWSNLISACLDIVYHHLYDILLSLTDIQYTDVHVCASPMYAIYGAEHRTVVIALVLLTIP